MKLQQRDLASVIDHYVKSRAGNSWPISTRQAIRAIRSVLDCHVADRMLETLIAQAAIRHGSNVSFDLDEDAPLRLRSLLPGDSANDNGATA